METLHTQFQSVREALKLPDLPIEDISSCLRFRIGGEEEIYLADHRKPNGAYIENALARALQLCNALPEFPNLLCILQDRSEPLPRKRLGLPAPDQIVPSGSGDLLYWQLQPQWLRPLFREIIRCELSAEGIEGLCGSVFLVCTARPLLFHLYDDRGAVLAAEPAVLHAMAQKFSSWLEP